MNRETRIHTRLERTHPFGGMRRYGFGIGLEYGTTGTTYRDPRSNMSLSLDITFFSCVLSVVIAWKGKA